MALDLQATYVLASGASRAMEQLDTITNNLANVNTTGFKEMVVKEMSQRLYENGGDANHLFVFPRFKESILNLTQGSLKHTQNRLDFALEGKGFFVVQKGNQKLLTRNGHFFINGEGLLVDQNGHYLLDTEDKPIRLEGKSEINVTEDGSIYQDGKFVRRLQIKNYDALTILGDTYYQSKGNEVESDAKVRQGFLESSNINPLMEMTEMIMAQRRFDMYGNMIKSIDQLNQKTNEIGRA
ncbi:MULTISPECIES: flagellar hook-basal body protein [unclassified Nitratiruptor]|uniref:flagellar hook-basal body protein n=1 Tax=unclassified Nitratiruptor TaxID=2624044 RepID=UPI001916B471|nr:MULTISPECIES: flagellar hook basal-body protein [unclassified Nitratiruptor]BCD59909.1 flagellar basal-body rod protein FlgG [Nitratiruptor sp. YY08-10]BCD63832.1 flagellar basal-body rod protein FlgG [Nitratiruptor sp. YY08-14]